MTEYFEIQITRVTALNILRMIHGHDQTLLEIICIRRFHSSLARHFAPKSDVFFFDFCDDDEKIKQK